MTYEKCCGYGYEFILLVPDHGWKLRSGSETINFYTEKYVKT